MQKNTKHGPGNCDDSKPIIHAHTGITHQTLNTKGKKWGKYNINIFIGPGNNILRQSIFPGSLPKKKIRGKIWVLEISNIPKCPESNIPIRPHEKYNKIQHPTNQLLPPSLPNPLKGLPNLFPSPVITQQTDQPSRRNLPLCYSSHNTSLKDRQKLDSNKEAHLKMGKMDTHRQTDGHMDKLVGGGKQKQLKLIGRATNHPFLGNLNMSMLI